MDSCVEQIGSKNIAAVSHCLTRLGELASGSLYTASSPTSPRPWPCALQGYGLKCSTSRLLVSLSIDDDALRVLNQVRSMTKFVHFTCNEILLRALEGKDMVHIIDFNIKQGLHWPSLFQSLAPRASPPSHVRITGIGESKQELIKTGDRLVGFDEAFNLPLLVPSSG